MTNSPNYTEEQILIRSMPCPKCGALPRHHCNRKPSEDGKIKNHNERQLFWHKHVKICKLQQKHFIPYEYTQWSSKRFKKVAEDKNGSDLFVDTYDYKGYKL